MRFFSILAAFAAVALAAPAPEEKPIEARNASVEARQERCYVAPEPDWNVIRQVWQICDELNCDARELLAAFETGLVESNFQNLPCGDQDSEGVWQQRASMIVWGNRSQIRNVNHSTRAFLGALFSCTRSSKSRGWSAGRCAQCAQVSDRPNAYDQMESRARATLNEARRRFGGGGAGDGAINTGGKPGGNNNNNNNGGGGGGGNTGTCDWTYTVKSGDTCAKIAKNGHTNAQNVINLNKGVINSGCTNLRKDQKICLRRKAGGGGGTTTTNNNGGGNQPRNCSWKDKVDSGDTCNKLAKTAKVSLDKFMANNRGRISDCRKLRVGQTVCMN